ncbi:uncharacterized protein LOC144659784 isoform X2 [Oculina patagonica]
MEKLEVIITVLLLCLVALGVYVATSWTLSRKKKKEDEGDREGVPYKYLDEEAENARKKVATAYAQETMPKITITPVQPRPDFPRSLLSSDELFSDEEEEESQSDDHLDLGRLYFALRYDQHRSMLIVRLIRAEDIPMDREATSTYVDVHLLPLNLQSHTFEPYETTINVSFREVYEFPLSQLDLAQQTLNLHICRYDSYSRRSSIGDVFLALAELSAQGIDFTREVFLCRNIISHQEIYRTLGRRKRLHPVDEEEQEEGEKKPESITKEKKVSRKVSSQRMWDVLRRAVKSGAYKGEYLPSESAMHWESIFSPGASSTEGYRFVSAPTSPVKSPDFAYFSGPGPSGERRDDTSEEEGEEEKEESAVDVPTDESEFESSADEQESDRRHVERSQSPPVKTVQLSPAPEEYYRIVPITPFTPYKDKGEVTEPSFSWKLPHTYTSRDRDVVQTLSQAYKEPRVVPFASVSQFEPGGPPAKKVSFNPPSVKSGSDVGEQRSLQSKTSRQKRVADTKKMRSKRSRKVVSSKERKKMSPRKEPDGEPAEKLVSSVRGKARHSTTKFRGKSSPSHKMAFRRKERGPTEGVSIEPPEEESLVEAPSRLTEDVARWQELQHDSSESGRMIFPSISTGDYRTSPMSPLTDFYSITRSQSDPSVDVEHFRTLSESSSGTRLTRSMLEVRGDKTTDEEDQ